MEIKHTIPYGLWSRAKVHNAQRLNYVHTYFDLLLQAYLNSGARVILMASGKRMMSAVDCTGGAHDEVDGDLVVLVNSRLKYYASKDECATLRPPSPILLKRLGER